MGFNHQGWRFTMGSTWMIGHDVIFDLKNQKIGFAEANCEKYVNNETMDGIGVENGYNFKEYELRKKNGFFDIFVNENLLGFYIFITIVLLLVIIYLVFVLINLKKRKKILGYGL